MSIKLLLVDDERPARRKMLRYLESATDFEVVGEADDGAEAIAAIERLHPDRSLPGRADAEAGWIPGSCRR